MHSPSLTCRDTLQIGAWLARLHAFGVWQRV